MKTEKILIFTALISMNIIIWCEALGSGFLVGVVQTAIFFILIRRKK